MPGILSATLLSLAGAVAPSPPSCTDLLEGLRAKLEADYAGYQLEVAGHRDAAYGALLTGLRRRAAGVAAGGDCFPVLEAFIAWFDDPHLFVYQSPRLDSAEARRRLAEIRTVPLDEAGVRRTVAARGTKADPIEGIWHERGLRLGVVPNPGGTPGRFIAVVLSSDTTTLQAGMVGAVFTRRGDAYTVELRWRSMALTRPPVSLHRSGTLLRMSPTIWSKAWPIPAGEPAPPDTADARRPTWGAVDGVPVIAIPSHQYQYKAVLDSLLAVHHEALQNADYLVVDLRGTEGGASPMSNGLLPYLVGEPEDDPSQVDGMPVLLSSPDQIGYARRAFGSDSSAFVRRLVAAMEAAPGRLVPMFDSGGFPVDPDPAAIYGPQRVAVLIDGGTVSAAEVLVLKARRSARALVIGEPTAGALDYQSTSIVSIHPEEKRFYLGYPTITARADLPKGGMRGKGIAPERPLRWSSVADPVRAAIRLLQGG